MKTIIKIIYIAFCLVLAVIIALGMYTSFASSNYSALLTNAVAKAKEAENYQDAEYSDIARCFSIFSTPLENEPSLLYAEENGKNIIFIYESVNQHNASYSIDGKDETISRVENVYLVTILHPEFNFLNLSDKTNPSAFRFYGTNGKHYDYIFNLSADCNSGTYLAKPTTEKESVLRGGRSLLDTYRTSYDLIFFPLTETTMSFIKEQVGSDIAGFNIVDNATNSVYKKSEYVDFKFDFPNAAGTFYADMEDFVKYYNIYTENREGKGDYDTDTVNAASVYIESFTKDPSSMIPDFNTKYIQGYPRESVYTGTDMVMKTIGITLLFVVVVALIYILLFHLKSIKKFIRRFSKKEEPERKIPNRRPQTNVVISKSKVSREVTPALNKKEEVASEAKPVETTAVEETPVEEAKPVETTAVEETPVEEAKVEEVEETTEEPALEAAEEETTEEPVEEQPKEDSTKSEE